MDSEINERMEKAAKVLDTVASFIGWREDSCIRKQEYDSSADPVKSASFIADGDTRRSLIESIDRKTAAEGEGDTRYVSDEDGTRLIEVGETSDGFCVSVNDRMLGHPRFGNVMTEVWFNIYH